MKTIKNNLTIILKKVAILACTLTSTSVSLYAQNVGIGATSFTPSSKSMLDIQSTNSGLLIPRMTDVQRLLIAPGPTDYGLMVYQTNTVSAANCAGYWYWDGTIWVRSNSSNGWNLTGNTGTSASTNFIGTTDSVDFIMKTNNTERARIKAGGNFGIGTWNPTQKLHVEAPGSAGPIVRVHSSTDAPSTISLSTNYRTYRIGQNRPPDSPTSADGFFIYDQNANATRQYINSAGNVGIGTLTPTQKLSVSAGMNVDNNNTNTGNLTNALLFGNASGEGIASKRTAGINQYGLDFYQNDTNRMRIWNNGQICIGRNSSGSIAPLADLTILDPSTASQTVDVPVFTARHSGSSGTTWQMGSIEYYVEGEANIGFSYQLCPLTSHTSTNLGSAAGSRYFGYRWNQLNCSVAPNISSDTTLKENIQPVVYGLKQVRKMNPIAYTFKNDFGGTDKELATEDKRTHLGFNAQELKQVIPEVVSSWEWVPSNEREYKKAKTKTLGVYYDEVIPVIVNAVKDLDNQQQNIISSLTISDFGSVKETSVSIEVKYSEAFLNNLQGKPVVTITPTSPGTELYVTNITTKGFVVNSNISDTNEISFNWMAMAKINKGNIENQIVFSESAHAEKLKTIEKFENSIPAQEEIIRTGKISPSPENKH